MRLKGIVSTVVLSFAALTSVAQTQQLFTSVKAEPPYRIPAITSAKNGDLVVVCDYRPCGSDIGYGEVDLMSRRSSNYGWTWSSPVVVADGTGVPGAVDCGFGDPALVADRTTGRMLLISVCGNTPYWSAKRNNPNRVARFRSEDGGRTWSSYEEITEEIYRLFDKSALGPVESLFFGSGRIMQSRLVKVGKYYRLYAALCAKPNGNRVIYSDDFGETWHVLGSIDVSPAPGGDEPKCEELPDGSVVLSSRKHYGRYFNIFTYSDTRSATGSWDTPVESNCVTGGIAVGSNACNGEILLIDARNTETRKKCKLMLQSLPTGNERRDVTIYYKVIDPKKHYTSETFAQNWEVGLLVSKQYSAYSTMILQKNGRVGFFYEEGPTEYNMVYKSLSIKEITRGLYQ